METIKILQRVRHKHNISINSPINLFITNGEFIIAIRYVLDYGWEPATKTISTHFAYHSLWYTYGEEYGFFDNEYKMKGKKSSSIIVASEPLTEDTSTWVEVPEYTLLVARLVEDGVSIITRDINL
jgi:glutamine amidotransferase